MKIKYLFYVIILCNIFIIKELKGNDSIKITLSQQEITISKNQRIIKVVVEFENNTDRDKIFSEIPLLIFSKDDIYKTLNKIKYELKDFDDSLLVYWNVLPGYGGNNKKLKKPKIIPPNNKNQDLIILAQSKKAIEVSISLSGYVLNSQTYKLRLIYYDKYGLSMKSNEMILKVKKS